MVKISNVEGELVILEPVENVAFLLGAGTSSAVDLPTSAQLTELILDDLQGDSRHLGRLIVSLMQTHRARQRLDTTIDIEALIGAILLLAGRDRHLISAFVSTWQPLVSTGPGYTPDRWDSQFMDEIHKSLGSGLAHGGSGFPPRIADMIQNLVSSAPNSGRLLGLSRELTVLTLERLKPTNLPTDHLRPMFDYLATVPNAPVATLNFDTVIERVGLMAGIDFDTGWKPGPTRESAGQLDFDTERPNLLKLHGSLDWPHHYYEHHNPVERFEAVVSPVLAFGTGDKLLMPGPFLDLLIEWRQRLSIADRLVIVGYSFRDEHINRTIEQWLDRSDRRHIVVINPDRIDPKEVPVQSTLRKVLDADLRAAPKGPAVFLHGQLTVNNLHRATFEEVQSGGRRYTV